MFVEISFWSAVVGEKFVFHEAYKEVGVARSHFSSHCKTLDLFVVVVASSARQSKVSELGFFDSTLIKKVFECLEAFTVGNYSVLQCTDIMSMLKMILFSPGKLKVRKFSSSWLLSFTYEGNDLTMGVMTLSK